MINEIDIDVCHQSKVKSQSNFSQKSVERWPKVGQKSAKLGWKSAQWPLAWRFSVTDGMTDQQADRQKTDSCNSQS